jgi:hypothetical protein
MSQEGTLLRPHSKRCVKGTEKGRRLADRARDHKTDPAEARGEAACCGPPGTSSGKTVEHLLARLIVVGVGFGIAFTGFMVILTILLVFIGLPLFFVGLAVMEVGLKGWQ